MSKDIEERYQKIKDRKVLLSCARACMKALYNLGDTRALTSITNTSWTLADKLYQKAGR